MEWTDVLAEIADSHCLSPEQTEAFLIRFRLDDGNRDNGEAKLASELNISAGAIKKRMSGVYKQFAQSCPELAAAEKRGKLQKLRAYLRTKYSERSPKPLIHSELNEVRDIQPIPESINWRDICGKVLAQQREKQNFRRPITGRHLGHEAKNVYVKLGLVQPKGQPRRDDESQPSADRGVLQYQLTEKEIEQKYQYDEFLEQVIEGKEKNFTIVGEPGAGKSTWLEQIALYVNNSNKGFPICISLASLGGKTLEEYLCQIWLKNALLISQCDVGITSAQKKLEELFKSSKVWLLLDGVDEMRADESPLQAIATQLEGWGDLARVVLTCRANVWEVNPNALLNFETYRTLHFDDEQVGDFIQQWFTQEGEPELGEQLETKLDDARNDRIRDLIKNPLRLAMLCGIWYFHQGDLPKTKAILYQQYIEYFYRWKQHPQLTDDLDKQEKLHTAFSKLALEAIDKKLPLRRKFAHKVMGKSLFQLARDVGWLNWVYKDAETGEDVYAFFHLTFQEYFAACAIDDWHFFLNHVPDNPMQGTYRIFEPQWKEVILLWLGRQDVDKVHKDVFIEALVYFEDGIESKLYQNQAFFLASKAVAEFRDCRLADDIVTLLVAMGFSYLSLGKKWVKIPMSTSQSARATLLETERSRATTTLGRLIDSTEDEVTLCEVAEMLGRINIGNPTAISTLIELIKNSPIKKQAAFTLGQIHSGNSEVIEILIQQIQSSTEGTALMNAVECIGYIGTNNLIAINTLIKLVKHYRDFAAIQSLGKITQSNPEAIKILTHLAKTDEDALVRKEAAFSLGQIEPGNSVAIETLIELMQKTEEGLTSWRAALDLGEIARGNSVAIQSLMQLVQSTKNRNILECAACCLGRIDPGNSVAIQALIWLAKMFEKRFEIYLDCSLESIESEIHVAKNKTVAIEELIKLMYAPELYISGEAAFNLTHIGKGNTVAIQALVNFMQNVESDFHHKNAAYSLTKILQGDGLLLAVSLLRSSLTAHVYKTNFERYENYHFVIWHCAQNLPYPEFYQAWHQTTIHKRR